MKPTRRLTRREYAENAALLAGIKTVPANHQPADIIGYGRYPYPLRFAKELDTAPMTPRLKAIAFLPAETARRIRRVENIGLTLCVVLAAILLAMMVTIS
jgi:ABC-type cobalamin/Fe3+-siderophores transport system ATPase subunit